MVGSSGNNTERGCGCQEALWQVRRARITVRGEEKQEKKARDSF